MRTLILVALLLVTVSGAEAQTTAAAPPPPCSTPEFRQLDFWVGDWNLTWPGGEGTNVITRVLGDCVIEENFQGTMPNGFVFVGNSVSIYNASAGHWQQTWVDNQGSYLDFTGGPDGDRFIFSREAVTPAGTTQQRMVFLDVEPDSFTWSWELSRDGGETWAPSWVIQYKRAGS